MDYFFIQQDDIPSGMGYPLFGPAHILSVLITLFLVCLACLGFRKLSEDRKRRVLRFIPILMIFLELLKDTILIIKHRFGVGYLPLHMCSIGLFVFLLREFLPSRKQVDITPEQDTPNKSTPQAIFGEIAFAMIMPASLAALLFADWNMYPVLNFFNLHGYLWHGLLILYPLLLRTNGFISPTVRHIHWIFIFLAIVVPPIYLFDKAFKCNYFFVNWPIPDSPLSLFAKWFGNPGYLAAYLAFTVVVILIVYLLNNLFTKFTNKSARSD
ncbi:MAG: YwaF family protein [Lachnospiraceae bacterium]|nr:YwaF family protein [Lachnospiraceae bacterium]